MRIGIDVSQTAFESTGVSAYLTNLVQTLITLDKRHQYVLFFSSLRRKIPKDIFELSKQNNVTIKSFRFPPGFLDFLWNKVHKISIERFIGNVDIFISSDWTEPPVRRAKKATILYDLIVYKYPKETDKRIIQTQKRRLRWVRKEADVVFCISESTKKDASDILSIDKNKLQVLYPGI